MSTDLSLYDCQELIRLIEEQAEKNDGELSDSDWQLLVDAQTKSMEKLDKLVNYISMLDRFCDIADAEMNRIKERKQIAKNSIDGIKKYLLPYVQQRGGKVTVGTHQLSTRKSTAVVVADGFDNRMYCRVIPESLEPDKKKIKESIESGVEVKGAILEKREGLVIK
jgi:hypothetical protein